MEQALTNAVGDPISTPDESTEAQGVDGNVQEAKETKAEQVQRYKLKVNGRDVEKTIDELLRDAQLGLSATEKFQQASSMSKKYSQYEQMEKALESGDMTGLIDKVGPDKFREFAENYLIDYLEYQQLSPEKKEALEYKKMYESQKAKLDAQDKERQDLEVSKVKAQAIDEIDAEIASILKESGKKPKPYFVARIAENMLASLQTRSVDPKSAAKSAFTKAMSSVQDDVSEYLSEMSAEEARRVLPKSLLDALRSSDVEAVRSQDPMRSRSTTKTEAKPSKQPGKKVNMSTEEFFKQHIEKRLGA